ncbi:uncharacterized protein LOC133176885 [Saccostrea echinata]|uniref:uncharacterized protein LOC133176885 n=1 Tax=Saccostrea echinata TaxID=191078 RepID=UPI002A7FF9A7|nr:uncharacterized protein LOC133176885 [Saccostrea echinata]
MQDGSLRKTIRAECFAPRQFLPLPLIKGISLSHHENCLRQMCPHGDAFNMQTETVKAALLTNHLLSHLVFNSRYLLNTGAKEEGLVKCPCLKPLECRTLLNYGQIGLGSESLWYGHPDIVLIPPGSPNIPVWFYEDPEHDMHSEDTTDFLSQNSTSDDLCKVTEKHSIFGDKAGQIISQAITHSFSEANMNCKQLTENKHLFHHTLIPTLTLTPDHYCVVMYDYENDILLSSGHQKMSLWDDSGLKFNLSAVLQIWMVLNHRFFSPKLDDVMQRDFSHSCNLHQTLKDMQVFDKTKDISFRHSFEQKSMKYFMPYSNYIKLENK